LYESTDLGCVGYDTLVVRIAPYPEPYFSYTFPGAADKIQYVDSTIQDSIWDVNQNGEIVSDLIEYDLYWNFGKNYTDRNAVDTIIHYDSINKPYLLVDDYVYGPKPVTMTAINSFGCSATYEEEIFVEISAALYVPEAFAPNNPALGVRIFQPKGFNIETMEVYVYDVWGNLVWFSNEVENGNFVGAWDGTYNGKALKSDSYVWKINAVFVDGVDWKGKKDSKGHVSNYGSVLLIR